MLDPYDVPPPSGWVSNIVQLSSNHAGVIGDVTVTVNIPVDLPIGTVVTITMPSFTVPSSGVITLLTLHPAANDNIFVFPGVTNPSSAGVYGPISLVVTQSATGQVIAQTKSLGSLAILPAVSIGTAGLTVAYGSSASKAIATSTTLSFTFTLSARMNLLDYFVLTLDSNMGIGTLGAPAWTMTTSSVLASFNTTGYAYTPATTLANGNPVPAYYTIYGLQQAFYNSTSISFTISGFKNAATLGISYSGWDLKVMRFGTNTILQEVTGTGPTGQTGGTIAAGTWVSSNGYVSTSSSDTKPKVVTGATIYTTLTFSTVNAIPAGGTIVATYTTTSILNDYPVDAAQALRTAQGASSYYDYTPKTYLSGCTISGVALTCTVGSAALPASTSIALYTLTTLAASNTVSVATYGPGSLAIDTGTTIATITTVSSGYGLISTATQVAFSSTNNPVVNTAAGSLVNMAGATGASPSGLFISHTAADPFTAPFSFYVMLPIALSTTASDTSISVGTTALTGMIGYCSKSAAGAQAPNYALNAAAGTGATTTAAAITPAVSSNNITLPLVTGPTYIAGDFLTWYAIPPTLIFPNLGTGEWSRHEYVFGYLASASWKYVSGPLYFEPNSAGSLSFLAVCTSGNAGGVAAQIIYTSPFNYSPSGATYHIDFVLTGSDTAISDDMGSGLGAPYTDYPVSYSPKAAADSFQLVYYDPTAPPTRWYITTSKSPVFRFNSTTALVAATPLTFIIPFMPLVSPKTYTLDAYLVVIDSASNFYYPASPAVSTITATAAVTVDSGTTATMTAFATAAITSNTFSNVSPTVGSGTNTAFSLSFSKGFTVTTASSVPTASISIAGTVTQVGTIIPLASSNAAFNWFVLYSTTAYKFAAAANPAIIVTVNGVTAGYMVASPTYAYNYYVGSAGTASGAGGFTSAACSFGVAAAFKFTAAALTSTSYSPTSVVALGTTSQRTTVTLAITSPQILPGWKIGVTLGNYWGLGGTGAILSLAGSVIQASACTYSTLTCLYQYPINSATAASAGSITITVSNLLVPSTVPSPAQQDGIAGVNIYNTAQQTNAVYTWVTANAGTGAALAAVQTTFTAGVTTQSVSTITTLRTFPIVNGAKNVYFQIAFTVPVAIPAGSTILIAGDTFASDGNAQFNTWCNQGFASVAVGSGLSLTTTNLINANTNIEVRKDMAFNIASVTGTAWKITITKDSQNIVLDTATTNVIKYLATPTGTVTSSSVVPGFLNMGYSTYTHVSFTLDTNTTDSTRFCFDTVGAYNAHPGFIWRNSPSFTGQGSIYYMDAWSNVTVNASCWADHFLITCDHMPALKAGTGIQFSFSTLNPAAVTAATWGIYVTDASGNLFITPAYVNTAAFTALPNNNIDVYNVSRSSNGDGTSNLNLTAIFTDTAYALYSGITVWFPQSYDLDVYNPNTVTCSGTYYGATTTVFVPVGTSCATSDNKVLFNVSTTFSPAINYFTSLTFNSIKDPVSGLLPRSGTSVDLTDTARFNVYGLWTQKFWVTSTIGNYNSATSLSSQSYMNLDAAYVGYALSSLLPITINGGNTLIVAPGTYSSPATISVGATLQAFSLVLSASDVQMKTVTTDQTSYTLTPSSPSTTFMVGCPYSAAASTYYLVWTVKESPLLSGTNKYAAPPMTAVFTFVDSTVGITAGSPAATLMSTGSLPLLVTLANYPYEDLTITPTLSPVTSSISFVPASLPFGTRVLSQNFIISINGSTNATQSYSVSYVLSGTDKWAYGAPAAASFKVGTTSLAAAANISCNLTITSTSAGAIYVTNDSPVILTWVLTTPDNYATYAGWYTYSNVITKAYPVFGTPTSEQYTVTEQFNTWASVIAGLKAGTSYWSIYILEVSNAAMTQEFYGQVWIATTNTAWYKVQAFNNLIAASSYIAIVFGDNLSGQTPTSAMSNATTAALPANAEVGITFAEAITAANQNLMSGAFASTLGIDASRVAISNTARRQLSTTVYATIYSDAADGTPALTYATNLTPAKVQSSLSSVGVTVATPTVATPTVLTAASYGTPAFTNSTFSVTSGVVYFNWTAAVNGYVYCAYELNVSNTSTAMTSNELYLGQDWTGATLPSAQWMYTYGTAGTNYQDGIVNMTLAGEYWNYTFFCTVCNDYVGYPDCISGTLPTFTYLWPHSFANYMMVALSAILAILV
jgi:hypothetical protein